MNRVWTKRRWRSRMRRAAKQAFANPGVPQQVMPGLTLTINVGLLLDEPKVMPHGHEPTDYDG